MTNNRLNSESCSKFHSKIVIQCDHSVVYLYSGKAISEVFLQVVQILFHFHIILNPFSGFISLSISWSIQIDDFHIYLMKDKF